MAAGAVGSSARAPAPVRRYSALYPLTSIHPPTSIQRFPLLQPETKEAEEFADESRKEEFWKSLKKQYILSRSVVGLRVVAREASEIQRNPALKGVVLRIPKVRHLVHDESSQDKRVLLLNVAEVEDLPEWTQTFIHELETKGRLSPTKHQIKVDYDYWTVEEVLAVLLPEGLPEGTPTAFTATGHIAHLNLREEYLPYRHVIGQVVLDKNGQIDTVVNKLDSIDTQFRFFKMETLAGKEQYEVTVSESNCSFTFDFRSVYWNSRLHAEHARLVNQFGPYSVMADVMAGVGPFAVPAAKKGCWVMANDLNPSSYESLAGNAKKNKVDGNLRTYCEDGRDFIRKSITRCWEHPFLGKPKGGEEVEKLVGNVKNSKQRAREQHDRAQGVVGVDASKIERESSRHLIDHFVMNLPGSALEFLDAYKGAYRAIASDELEEELKRREATGEAVWPMVHVHCFTKDLERPHEDICQRANERLGLQGDQMFVPPPSPPPDRRALMSAEVMKQKSNGRVEDGEGGAHNKSIATHSSATPDLSLHYVRAVAPNKDMYCLSFRLTRDILLC